MNPLSRRLFSLRSDAHQSSKEKDEGTQNQRGDNCEEANILLDHDVINNWQCFPFIVIFLLIHVNQFLSVLHFSFPLLSSPFASLFIFPFSPSAALRFCVLILYCTSSSSSFHLSLSTDLWIRRISASIITSQGLIPGSVSMWILKESSAMDFAKISKRRKRGWIGESREAAALESCRKIQSLRSWRR